MCIVISCLTLCYQFNRLNSWLQCSGDAVLCFPSFEKCGFLLSAMSRLSVLTKDILPLVAEKSCLEYVGCENNAKSDGDNQAMSTVMFLTMKVKRKQSDDNDQAGLLDLPVVVKFQIDFPGVRKWLQSDDMFYNEVSFYKKILPALNLSNIDETLVNDLFPKFYYGNATLGKDPEKDILILVDLRKDGYRLTEETLFLDYDHIALAMKNLGRLHGLSYMAKQRNPEEFFRSTSQLVESRYGDIEYWSYMFKFGVQRLFARLTAKGGKYSRVMNNYSEMISDTKKLLQRLLGPEEPMAVFCHGDYCRNNVLYRYNELGEPVDMKCYDLGMSRYSSPAVDLCFFLYLNATSDMRRKHWDNFLSLYHESLVTAAPGVVVPSLQDVHAEVRAKGVYAFLVCSFFLPMMAAGKEFVPTDHVHKSTEDRAKIVLTWGGDREVGLLELLFVELVEREIIC